MAWIDVGVTWAIDHLHAASPLGLGGPSMVPRWARSGGDLSTGLVPRRTSREAMAGR
jgi:hypothetical protein